MSKAIRLNFFYANCNAAITFYESALSVALIIYSPGSHVKDVILGKILFDYTERKQSLKVIVVI